ncbi:hypothetical protein [Amycolatopsis sp. H20-H5]|uniref:hypothetical protein n=1 Tax=Amycolatopsis sp. H20-H5 TaxID=3046309 RepID=UPI002DBBDE82|nr:hypothetical protein [Amycolatopsis sp. H20-H5]MEC3975330.1 hypothetical protein [Amycolatopsis sp. H20-H5]
MTATPAVSLYREPGVSWVALVWGPLFAVLGAVAELTTGPVHVLAWVFVAAGLVVVTLPWVYARRRFLSLEVTTEGFRQGREVLEAARIAEVADLGSPVGARVLGGGWSVPRKYDELPIRLDDGTVVLAWALDVEELQAALTRLVQARAGES